MGSGPELQRAFGRTGTRRDNRSAESSAAIRLRVLQRAVEAVSASRFPIPPM